MVSVILHVITDLIKIAKTFVKLVKSMLYKGFLFSFKILKMKA